MGVATTRERETLRFIQKRGKVSAVAVSKHLNVGTDYAALLCDSLARGGYVYGSRLRGYQLSPAGEALLQGDPLAGTPLASPQFEETQKSALTEKVAKLAEGVAADDFGKLISELFILNRRLREEELKKLVGFRCTVGREFHPNHWGKLSVFVVNGDREEPIQKSKLVRELIRFPDPQSARLGLWTRYGGRLPAGMKIKVFADGGDKEGRYRKYQEQQEWFFILDLEADELTFLGEYAGTFTARMRPVGECPLIGKKFKQPASKKDKEPTFKPDMPAFTAPKPTPKVPKSGWDWGQWG